MKWIWWLAILAGLWWWQRSARSPSGSSTVPGPNPSSGRAKPASPAGPLEIVPCAHCGVHVPRGEAVCSPTGDEYFCCEAHRIARQGQPGSSRSATQR